MKPARRCLAAMLPLFLGAHGCWSACKETSLEGTFAVAGASDSVAASSEMHFAEGKMTVTYVRGGRHFTATYEFTAPPDTGDSDSSL